MEQVITIILMNSLCLILGAMIGFQFGHGAGYRQSSNELIKMLSELNEIVKKREIKLNKIIKKIDERV